jgi:hypothetical protein
MEPGTFVEPWPEVEADQEAPDEPVTPAEPQSDSVEQPPEAA